MTIKMAHNYQNLFIYRRSNTRTNQTKMWLEVDFFFIFFKIFLHGFSNFWKHLLSKCWHLIGRNEHQMQPFQVLFIFFAGVMNSKNAFLFCLTPSRKGLILNGLFKPRINLHLIPIVPETQKNLVISSLEFSILHLYDYRILLATKERHFL